VSASQQFQLRGYADVRLIGQGGFSTVYAARQISLDRLVAIKVMTADDDAAAMIDSELRAMAQMAEHPNIAQILEHGIDTAGHPYLVMPLYRESLADLISQHGRLDLETTLRMGVKLSGALHSLNEAGILHRDIKPSNVLLNRFGDVVLCDFGLSIATQAALEIVTEGLSLTVPYAPPEVIQGERAGPPADVYALGATLFTCIAGRRPYDAPSTLSLIRKIIEGQLPSFPDDVDHGFADLLRATLSRNPRERPKALDMGRAMQAIQREHGLPMAEMTIPDERRRSARERQSPVETTVDPTLLDTYAEQGSLTDETSQPSMPGAILPPSTARPPRTAPRSVDQSRALMRPGTYQAPPSPALRSGPPFDPPTTRRPAPPNTAPEPNRGYSKPASGPRRVMARIAFKHQAVMERIRFGVTRAIRSLATLSLFGRQSQPSVEDQIGSWLGRMSADRPTSTDLLGHRPLMEGVAQVLNDPGTALPITIAMCGQWGAGKSSMMLQLGQRLCVKT